MFSFGWLNPACLRAGRTPNATTTNSPASSAAYFISTGELSAAFRTWLNEDGGAGCDFHRTRGLQRSAHLHGKDQSQRLPAPAQSGYEVDQAARIPTAPASHSNLNATNDGSPRSRPSAVAAPRDSGLCGEPLSKRQMCSTQTWTTQEASSAWARRVVPASWAHLKQCPERPPPQAVRHSAAQSVALREWQSSRGRRSLASHRW